MDITSNNTSPLIKKKVIHTDFCDIHITIDKQSKQPTDDAYITISDTQTIWLANHADSVFLPIYFFDAFNKSKLKDKNGHKIIPLCKSPVLNSNSYDGYNSEQTFPAWNFQIKGTYCGTIDNNKESTEDTPNPHFLKIFHDNNGNCNIVQAGEFNSLPGRNLNVGYTKKVATAEDQISKKYQAGLFTDKAEKMDNFIATLGRYKKKGIYGSETDNTGFGIICKDKKMPYRLCQNLDSKWNAAICKNVYYDGENEKFNINYHDLSTGDLETLEFNYCDSYINEQIFATTAINYTEKEKTFIHTSDTAKILFYDDDIFENTKVVDKKTNLTYHKVARISVNKKKGQLPDECRYIVVTNDKENPEYKEAILTKLVDKTTGDDIIDSNGITKYLCEIRDINDSNPIAVSAKDIIQCINKDGEMTNIDTRLFREFDYFDVNGMQQHADARLGGQDANYGKLDAQHNVAFYYSKNRLDCSVANNKVQDYKDGKYKLKLDDIANGSNVKIHPIYDHNDVKECQMQQLEENINNSSARINTEALDNLIFI